MPLSSARVFDYSDDAAVAKLLADEAKAASTRYTSQGLSALLPKRSAGAAPKPNTRFLKNLVRDADQHNAALRRKEDRERVERLRNGGLKRPHDAREDSQSLSERSGACHRVSKRRRSDERDKRDRNLRGRDPADARRRHHRKRSRSRSRTGALSDDEHPGGRSRKHEPDRRSGSEEDDKTHRERHTSHRKHRRRRSRSRSSSPPRDHRRRHPTSLKKYRDDHSESSDPLEELVGPMPANADQKATIRYKGRGAHKLATTSNIDDHFSSKYDPALDVQPDAEDTKEREDWDMALEALRDRQIWQKKHADRMRAAGFSNEEIRKWEDSGREKDIRDVRWTGKGQTRAWDVGKDVEVSEDGDEDPTGRLTP